MSVQSVGLALRDTKRNGLAPSDHRIFFTVYKDTISGAEIVEWLINVGKVATNAIDAEHLAQSLLSEQYIVRIDEQKQTKPRKKVRTPGKIVPIKANTSDSIGTVNSTLANFMEAFENTKKALYRHTRKGLVKRKGKPQTFSEAEARSSYVKTREMQSMAAQKMGINLVHINDTQSKAEEKDKQRKDLGRLKRGPTPLQVAHRMGYPLEQVEIQPYMQVFSTEDGAVNKLDRKSFRKLQHNELMKEHDMVNKGRRVQHKLPHKVLTHLNKKKKSSDNHALAVQQFVFLPSRESCEKNPELLLSITIPKANVAAASQVISYVMKGETNEHRNHLLQ
jgi:hypothetical protein